MEFISFAFASTSEYIPNLPEEYRFLDGATDGTSFPPLCINSCIESKSMPDDSEKFIVSDIIELGTRIIFSILRCKSLKLFDKSDPPASGFISLL